jgi:lia operon protein LiaG
MSKNGLIGVVLIAVGVWLGVSALSSGNVFAWNLPFTETKEVNLEQSFDASNIKEVVVDVSSTDVRVVRGSSEKIEVRLQGEASPKIADQYRLTGETNGSRLQIGLEKQEGFRMFRYESVDLTVELPEKQWDELKVGVGSGDITVEDVEGKSIDLSARSGDVNLEASNASTIVLSTNSGDIQAEGFHADTLKFHSDSGDVSLKEGEAILKGEAESGDIQIEFAELLHDVDVSASSGDVNIKLEQEPKSLTVDYRGGSGTGHVRWDGFQETDRAEDGEMIKGTFGSGKTMLKVSTGSGDFTLD